MTQQGTATDCNVKLEEKKKQNIMFDTKQFKFDDVTVVQKWESAKEQ